MTSVSFHDLGFDLQQILTIDCLFCEREDQLDPKDLIQRVMKTRTTSNCASLLWSESPAFNPLIKKNPKLNK